MAGFNGEVKLSLSEESMAALQKFTEKIELFVYQINKLSEITERLTEDLRAEIKKIEISVERVEDMKKPKWDERL